MRCGNRREKKKMGKKSLEYIKKRAAVVLTVLLLCAGALTGCGSRTRLAFTTGLSGKQIFKIGSAECDLPEIMVYLTTFYSRYADTYGAEMWKYDFEGTSLEEHVKEVVLSKMTQIKIMNLMAEERGIYLTEEEKSKVLAAADAYEEKLGETLRLEEGMNLKVIRQVYREYAIANKVYETITESEDMEISDDEARTVTVQTVFFPTWRIVNGERAEFSEEQKNGVRKDASAILNRLQSGENFETAARDGDGRVLTENYARGDAEEALEEILFSMDEGDLSDVLEMSDGYYIVKCISTMDDKATQENKLVLAKKRKSEAFSDAYREIEGNTYAQFRDKLWKKVSMDEKLHRTEADFFDIYDQYVKQ